MICIEIIGQYGYIVCVIIGTFLLLYQKIFISKGSYIESHLYILCVHNVFLFFCNKSEYLLCYALKSRFKDHLWNGTILQSFSICIMNMFQKL